MDQHIQIREYCHVCDDGYLYEKNQECPYCNNGWVYKWVRVADMDQIEDYFEIVSMEYR